MKSAFEQVYGAPYLARMLFAEVGLTAEADLFLRVDYDGSIATNGATFAEARHDFAVISGTRESAEAMESFLKTEHNTNAEFSAAVTNALNAWSLGHMVLQQKNGEKELPGRDQIIEYRQKQLTTLGIEAGVLERQSTSAIRYRSVTDAEIRRQIAR